MGGPALGRQHPCSVGWPQTFFGSTYRGLDHRRPRRLVHRGHDRDPRPDLAIRDVPRRHRATAGPTADEQDHLSERARGGESVSQESEEAAQALSPIYGAP